MKDSSADHFSSGALACYMVSGEIMMVKSAETRYLFSTKMSSLAIQYPLALSDTLTFFMVMPGPSQSLVKVREISWSGLNNLR